MKIMIRSIAVLMLLCAGVGNFWATEMRPPHEIALQESIKIGKSHGDVIDERNAKAFLEFLSAVYSARGDVAQKKAPSELLRHARIVTERNYDLLKEGEGNGEAINAMKQSVLAFVALKTPPALIDEQQQTIVKTINIIAEEVVVWTDSLAAQAKDQIAAPLDDRLVELKNYTIDGTVVPRHIQWLEGSFALAGKSENTGPKLEAIIAQYIRDSITAEREQMVADTEMSFANFYYGGIGSTRWPKGWTFEEGLVRKRARAAIANMHAEKKKLPVIAIRGEIAQLFDVSMRAIFQVVEPKSK